jgi:hypothetical protein
MDRKRHSVAIGMTTGMHSVVIGERHSERVTWREALREKGTRREALGERRRARRQRARQPEAYIGLFAHVHA